MTRLSIGNVKQNQCNTAPKQDSQCLQQLRTRHSWDSERRSIGWSRMQGRYEWYSRETDGIMASCTKAAASPAACSHPAHRAQARPAGDHERAQPGAAVGCLLQPGAALAGEGEPGWPDLKRARKLDGACAAEDGLQSEGGRWGVVCRQYIYCGHVMGGMACIRCHPRGRDLVVRCSFDDAASLRICGCRTWLRQPRRGCAVMVRVTPGSTTSVAPQPTTSICPGVDRRLEHRACVSPHHASLHKHCRQLARWLRPRHDHSLPSCSAPASASRSAQRGTAPPRCGCRWRAGTGRMLLRRRRAGWRARCPSRRWRLRWRGVGSEGGAGVPCDAGAQALRM